MTAFGTANDGKDGILAFYSFHCWIDQFWEEFGGGGVAQLF